MLETLPRHLNTTRLKERVMSDGQSTITYKDIPGFPGYRAGSDGTVWSSWHRLASPGHGAQRAAIGQEWSRKKASLNEQGYLRVMLRDARGHKSRHYVHRIVLLAFVGPCPLGMECLHADSDPTNNTLLNLRWGTHADNVQDAIATGHILKGESQPNSKLIDSQVLEIRRLCAAGVGAVEIAQQFGLAHSTVGKITSGRAWRHVGGPVGAKCNSVSLPVANEIRRRHAAGESTAELVVAFGVSRSTVHNIVARRGRFAVGGSA